MVFGSNKILSRGGFYLREEAGGVWRQVPMFYTEGVEEENSGALAIQKQFFAPANRGD